MNKLLFIGLLILISNFSLFSQAKDWSTLNKNNISIDYPKDWELNESGQMGTNFILFSPLTSPKDQFRENVNLLVQDLTGYNLDLEKYVEISEKQIKTLMANGKIIKSKRVLNKELSYQKIIFKGKQGVLDLKFEQYCWEVEDKAYVLTLTCEENQFQKYKVIGEKKLNTFRFE